MTVCFISLVHGVGVINSNVMYMGPDVLGTVSLLIYLSI